MKILEWGSRIAIIESVTGKSIDEVLKNEQH
jgi:hypothetical protein